MHHLQTRPLQIYHTEYQYLGQKHYNYVCKILLIVDEQSIGALIISVSAAHMPLFSKIMSGAHGSAHFLKRERRSR